MEGGQSFVFLVKRGKIGILFNDKTIGLRKVFDVEQLSTK